MAYQTIMGCVLNPASPQDNFTNFFLHGESTLNLSPKMRSGFSCNWFNELSKVENVKI